MLTREQITKLQKPLQGAETTLPIALGVLGDPGRFAIFQFFMKHLDVCVTDVANIFGISVPAASQQLHVMERANLVKRERMGQMICYRLKSENPVVRSLSKLILLHSNEPRLKSRRNKNASKRK